MLPGVKLPRGKKKLYKKHLNIFITSKISIMKLHLKNVSFDYPRHHGIPNAC